MFAATDTEFAPWYVARSDDKKRARLNIITHLLERIPYKKLPREKIRLPERQKAGVTRAGLSVQVHRRALLTDARSFRSGTGTPLRAAAHRALVQSRGSAAARDGGFAGDRYQSFLATTFGCSGRPRRPGS